MKHGTGNALLAACLIWAACGASYSANASELQAELLNQLKRMHLSNRGPQVKDATNRVDGLTAAIVLGKALFSDTRLSATGQVSCATCHIPEQSFQDGKSHRRSSDGRLRRTQPLADIAGAPWFSWDGRKDSLWAQALAPLEDPLEHGATRTLVARIVSRNHRSAYQRVFGPLPDLSSIPTAAGPTGASSQILAWEAMSAADRREVNHVFVNVGKAIAAYVKTIQHAPNRLDQYIESLLGPDQHSSNLLTPSEIRGLLLFTGKGRCVQCHSGPLFTDHFFYSTRVPPVDTVKPDPGRAQGEKSVLADEFNCNSPHSDADPGQCAELRFISLHQASMRRAFKVPGLRGVAARAPYMHAGQLGSLREVLLHYQAAPESLPLSLNRFASHGNGSAIVPIRFSNEELQDLEAFLRVL